MTLKIKIKRRPRIVIRPIHMTRRNIAEFFNYLLFAAMMFIKAYGDACLANRSLERIPDDFKYVIMIGATLVAFTQLVHQGKIRNMFVKDLKAFCLVIGIWALISLLLAPNLQYSVDYAVKYWIYILLPFFYSFAMISLCGHGTIAAYFKTALLICFGVYLFFEIGLDRFTVQNFMRISYGDSYSPFESSYSAGSAIMLCSYFGYNRKNNKLWMLLSIAFCMLTFKRAALIMMVIYLVVPMIADKNRVVKRKTVAAQIILVIVGTHIAAFLLHPAYLPWIDRLFDYRLDHILMGRSSLYTTLITSGYRPAGLGSTMDFLGNVMGKYSGIEMELIQLLWEVTIVGLSAFVIYCYQLTRRNLYCLLVMGFTMFNMLTSHSLDSPFTWMMIYLLIWDIHKQNRNEENHGECNELRTKRNGQ